MSDLAELKQKVEKQVPEVKALDDGRFQKLIDKTDEESKKTPSSKAPEKSKRR